MKARRAFSFLIAFVTAAAAVQIIGMTAADANAANPDPDTTGTVIVHADGTVTAKLSGTWSWPGQDCAGRYGETWAVDWWGISDSPVPDPNFELTDATEVTDPYTTQTGTVSAAGAIRIKQTGQYFHVAQYMAGQDINSASTCTDTGSGGTKGSEGAWSAYATYPSMADLPANICVIMYDPHGKEGEASKNPKDYSPVDNDDNSIHTNDFDPTQGAGYCVQPHVKHRPPGYMEICKSGAHGVHGTFTFTFGKHSVDVPAGACSASIKVSSGTVTIREEQVAGYHMVDATTQPAGRLVKVDPKAAEIKVTIVKGGVAKQTIVTVENAPNRFRGTLKVCQVAGAGVDAGTDFRFTNSVNGALTDVPAGPPPGGNCAIIGKFKGGSQVTVTQLIPHGDTVTKIAVRPRSRLVDSDLGAGTVTVTVGRGVTEMTYTDAAS